MGLRVFLLSFLNRLLSKKSKRSYRRSILVFSARWWRKSQYLSWEHSNSLLFAVLTNKCFNFMAPRYSFKPLASASGPNLRNLHFATAPVFLEYPSNWTCQWETLSIDISNMKLRLQKLQEADIEDQELRQQKANGYKKIKKIFQHQSLPFIPKAIWMELISRHHDNLLAGHFCIKKTCKLLAWKYYCPTLCHNVEAYIKGCDICLASKTVRHKP